MYKKIAFIFLSIIIFLGSSLPIFAQELSNGTAIGIQIKGNVTDGDIITSSPKGYTLASSPYDPQIYGVVSLNPSVYLKDTTATNKTPIISSGEVLVRVSSTNGNITIGDFITSSKIPGVGQKATDNGYVLGTAEQSYASNNSQKTALIRVTLQPHFAQITNNITHTIFSSFTLGLNDALNSPLGVIRYFIAGIITLLSFFFGFRFFARASNRGVEAIGRNPLAKQAILLSILINTIITIGIMFFGVAISYLILVL
ncbi:MAG TPA: hypothetical protein VNW29_00815 [Candidatus Sulfotelmatobacter sp.]|jgi:hypothetical protein|nr:hypothetical protein [Candidatus Sulfotelmatobacter sp.]